MPKPLEGLVACVTGGSRGIGRGIALQLAENGAKVYITGRNSNHSLSKEYEDLPTLEKTAQEIRSRGGEAVTTYCDHANPDEVKDLFEKIEADNGGQLDILVNNAFSGVKDIGDIGSKPFYECDPLFWDSINNVGLRNVYICSTLAAKMMVKRKTGLIVNISSAGALSYAFNVAYGVGKAAVDRMTADMAVELERHNVTVISIWPGVVRTELLGIYQQEEQRLERMFGLSKETLTMYLENGETIEFAGKCIAALAADRKIHKKTGKIFITGDVGREYNLKDVDGRSPAEMRQMRFALDYLGWHRLSRFIPGFIRIPHWMMHMASNRFG